MSEYNYVATVHKPTGVTHACFGHFTAPKAENLIIGKSTRLEIHLHTRQSLELLLDIPIYGRIANLKLFHPCEKDRDLLFIATEQYEILVLEWNPSNNTVLTRAKKNVSDVNGFPTHNHRQISIIDPSHKLIGLQPSRGLFKVIPVSNKGDLHRPPFNIWLEEHKVLDIKFLHGCTKPTIAVLYNDNKDAPRVKVYEVALNERNPEVSRLVKVSWRQDVVPWGANLLIPVRSPLGGVIIGGRGVAYSSASYSVIIKTDEEEEEGCEAPIFTGAYAEVPDSHDSLSKYFLGDFNGNLHAFYIKHEKGKVPDFRSRYCCHTSIASSILYLGSDEVFVGSVYGNSQLVQLSQTPYGIYLGGTVLESHVNLGPIVDFCAVDLEKHGQSQIVTCSGGYKDSSLRILCNQVEIKEKASIELQGITGMWTLQPNFDLLVVSFTSGTRIYEWSWVGRLQNTRITDFCSDTRTLYCGLALNDRVVQVISKSVRLIHVGAHSRIRILDTSIWEPELGLEITVATANDTQVLLATCDNALTVLEMHEGVLKEITHIKPCLHVSFLEINPIGDGQTSRALAVSSQGIEVYELPYLFPVTSKHLVADKSLTSILLHSFEGISYLLCGFEDGHLWVFVCGTCKGELAKTQILSIGTQPINLGTVFFKGDTHVFATSGGRSTVITIRNKKLVWRNVNVEEIISTMCRFANGVAIATEGKLTVGTIDGLHMVQRSIPLRNEIARRICHQKETKTFGVCSMKIVEPGVEEHLIQLVDDRNFEFLYTVRLEKGENACSIVSCSFSGDSGVYYCVGTAFIKQEQNEPTEGRVLVLAVLNGKLDVISVISTDGAVYSLNAFKGGLIAAIGQKIQMYKWSRYSDGVCELQHQCKHEGHVLALCSETRGDRIVVGDMMQSITLLKFNGSRDTIEQEALSHKFNRMTAVEFLEDTIYLGADKRFNLFTVKEGTSNELEDYGAYHLGDVVNRFRHGSFVKLPGSGHIPTVIFGTVNGAIGIVASLPSKEEYELLQRLEECLRKVIKGVGDLNHREWRSSYNKEKSRNDFLDGDLIEAFLDLDQRSMNLVSERMEVPVVDLKKRVGTLAMLH